MWRSWDNLWITVGVIHRASGRVRVGRVYPHIHSPYNYINTFF